jgi:hypothetical protein
MFKHRLFYPAPDAGDGGGGTPAGAAKGAGTDTAAAGVEGAAQGGGQPAGAAATAPSQEDVQAGILKDLGVDSIDDLQAIITAHNDAEAANRTDLENAKANLTKATTATQKAEARATEAEAQLAAYKQGVAEAHIGDALALARVELADKANPAKTIDDALADVLTRNPSFKGDGAAGVNPDGTSAVNDANVAGGKPTTTLTDFLKLTTSEQNEFKRSHPAEFAGLFK